jgi:hypothetical protein
MDISISWLGVLVAAISAFVVGGLWYSVLFAKPWQRAAGVTDDQVRSRVAGTFIGAFLLAVVIALVLAAFIGEGGVVFGTLAGLAAGLGWVAASIAMVALFERRPFAYIAINGGYAVVSYTAMGAILGAFQA